MAMPDPQGSTLFATEKEVSAFGFLVEPQDEALHLLAFSYLVF